MIYYVDIDDTICIRSDHTDLNYENSKPIKERIEFINQLYNASNINISSAVGEGCGLSLIEAAAAGTPSIAPYNSAIPEMLKDTGHLVKNCGIFNMGFDNGHWRPIADCLDMAHALEKEYRRWKKFRGESNKQREVRQECIDNIHKNYLWADKVDLLKRLMRDA